MVSRYNVSLQCGVFLSLSPPPHFVVWVVYRFRFLQCFFLSCFFVTLYQSRSIQLVEKTSSDLTTGPSDHRGK